MANRDHDDDRRHGGGGDRGGYASGGSYGDRDRGYEGRGYGGRGMGRDDRSQPYGSEGRWARDDDRPGYGGDRMRGESWDDRTGGGYDQSGRRGYASGDRPTGQGGGSGVRGQDDWGSRGSSGGQGYGYGGAGPAGLGGNHGQGYGQGYREGGASGGYRGAGTDRDQAGYGPQHRQYSTGSSSYEDDRGYDRGRGWGERDWRDRDQGRGDVGTQGGFIGALGSMLGFGGDRDQDRGRDQGRGRAPKGYTRSDARIEEDVNERLSRGGIDASEITVAVKDGEVTLSGTVTSRGDKRRAEDLADDVSGVKHVQNNVRVQAQSGWGDASSQLGARSAAPQAGAADEPDTWSKTSAESTSDSNDVPASSYGVANPKTS